MNPHPALASVSVLARSPGLDAAAVEAVVTLPTFKRPEHLLKTLLSLQAQETTRRFAVIVMENETAERAGAAAACPLFESGAVQGLLIVAHERGNCSAYNAGWATALYSFPGFKHLLVIDDDEVADPRWLETMCATAERLGADIVGGPQRPVFARVSDAGWATHPVFAPPYAATGVVPALYSSGNLLVSRRVLAAMPQPFLDTRFNFLGGGDSDFLSRSRHAGFTLGWCNEAPVYETVPARRTERDWIRQRSMRNGVISTIVETRRRRGETAGRIKVAAKSLALLGAALPRGLAGLLRTGSPASAIYPVHVALGRVLAEFGYQHEQYREPDKN